MLTRRNKQSWRALLTACSATFALTIGVAAEQDKSGLQRPSPSMPDTSIPEKIVPPQEGIPSPPATIGSGKDADEKERGGKDTAPPAAEPKSPQSKPGTGAKPADPSPARPK